jgi:hypothetical protein
MDRGGGRCASSGARFKRGGEELRCKIATTNDVAARRSFYRAGEEGKRSGGKGEKWSATVELKWGGGVSYEEDKWRG